MLEADGTKDKSNLGANAILACPLPLPALPPLLWRCPCTSFLGGVNGNRLPVPMMNILNGGAHAANTVDTQEFMIMPVGAPTLQGSPALVRRGVPRSGFHPEGQGPGHLRGR